MVITSIIGFIVILGMLFGLYAVVDATRETNRRLKELHEDVRDIADTIQHSSDRYI